MNARWGLQPGLAALVAGALALAGAGSAAGQNEDAARAAVSGQQCGSVVFQVCPKGEAPAPVRAAPARRGEPMLADGSDIFITDERLRDEAIARVFDRNLVVPPAGPATRDIGHGERCTGRFCTHGANEIWPQAGPVVDRSDYVF